MLRGDLFGVPLHELPWHEMIFDLFSVGVLALAVLLSYKFEGRRDAYRTAFFVISGYLIGRFLLT